MSDFKEEKKKKLVEIKDLIHGFCIEKFKPEYEGYCLKLCDTLGRKRKINILRSTSEQWAASIIYVIARLNFLFTADDICDFFHTKKSNTGNKATQIKKLCDLSLGAEGYCTEHIRDLFTFYETESGIIIPKFMLSKNNINHEMTDEEIAEEMEKHFGAEESIQERRQREKQERLNANKKKKDERNENQLGFFDS